MIMNGLGSAEGAQGPAAPLVEQVDLSFGPFTFVQSGDERQQRHPEAKNGVTLGPPSSEDALNTPRTATSDVNFNFIKSQIELCQESPPIVGKFNHADAEFSLKD